MHYLKLLLILIIAMPVSQGAVGATDQEIEKLLLEAFRPSKKESRQERAGKAIKEYKASGVLAFKPQRVDYADYYVAGRPTMFMGNTLVAVMEEYQVKYIGCCVNPGAGVYLRVVDRIEPLRQFARASMCRLEEYGDRKSFLAAVPFTAGMDEGKYAALLCQESDEAGASSSAPIAQAPTRIPTPSQAAPAPSGQSDSRVPSGSAARVASPIPMDVSAVAPVIAFHGCQYIVNTANGRINRNGIDCVVENTSGGTITSRSITYAKYDSQGVRMGPPYSLDTDLTPREKVRIRLLGTEDASRIVFTRETR